jgi:hypothetical protein
MLPRIYAAPGKWSDLNKGKVVCAHNDGLRNNQDTVNKFMDAMAQHLSGKPTAADAWATIFSQATSSTKLAMKLNMNDGLNPSKLVISKICNEVNKLGVPYGNMFVYDAAWQDGINNWNPSGLPNGVVKNTNNKGSDEYFQDVMQDNVLIISVAINCGHPYADSQPSTGYTLAMKNHFGTARVDNNKSSPYFHSNALIKKYNDTLKDRHPLSIISSMDAYGTFRESPKSGDNRIIMGVCAGSVDHLTNVNLRNVDTYWRDPVSNNKITYLKPSMEFSKDNLSVYNLTENDLEWLELTEPTPPSLVKPARPTGLKVQKI